MTSVAIAVEGGLIAAEVLDRIASQPDQVPGQKPAEFGLVRARLSDEIQAAFSDARAFWDAFQRRQAHSHESATTLTREAFVIPLLERLGYALTYQRAAVEAGGQRYTISHRFGESDGAAPVHIVAVDRLLDARQPGERLSPHALVQEYLNRTDALWGIVTNGAKLRLLRNSARIARPSYIEFDLAGMMEGNLYSEFALFYRLAHATRLPRASAEAHQSHLEIYYQQGIEEGGRVRDRLRDGVKQALEILGQGLLQHAGSEGLREAIRQGRLDDTAYYRQLLHLVYRLLFLMVAEERRLLLVFSADAAERHAIYTRWYSIGRLRTLAERRRSEDSHSDLWEGLKQTFRLFRDTGTAAQLALTALDGELFGTEACHDLERAGLRNDTLLNATYALSTFEELVGRRRRGVRRRVNYAGLDVEELGSVYESLLDFHPRVALDPPSFALIEGSERKTTGSYYTPPPLVHELINSALVPVIETRLQGARTKEEKERALLDLKVCDPASGSGHFLLAAARRIGRALAQVRTGEEEPAPPDYRHAVRDVVRSCLYAVDKNPLAVDLCKVALWLEGHEPGLPLSFLDHRIRCGDSLLGLFDLDMLKAGVPDEAYKPLTGDNRAIATQLRRKNHLERSRPLFQFDAARSLGAFAQLFSAVAAEDDATPAAVQAKAEHYRGIRERDAWRRAHYACDLWTAAFFIPKARVGGTESAPTTQDVWSAISTNASLQGQRFAAIETLARSQGFFHWPLEFPDVFARKGFDGVIGNPPWGSKIALSQIHTSYLAYTSGRSSKNMNVFAVFVDAALNRLLSPHGRLGFLVPKNFLKTESYIEYRRDLLTRNSLHEVIDFGQFPNVAQEAVGLVASGGPGMSSAVARRTYPISTPLAPIPISALLSDPRAVVTLTRLQDDPTDLLNRLRSSSIPLEASCRVLRGMEHGRAGRLAYCSSCSKYFEWPGKQRANLIEVNCPHCGRVVSLDQEPFKFITPENDDDGLRGLLIGTSIDRYRLREIPLFARLGVPGIDYKGLERVEPKLLFVRISPTLRGYLDKDGLLCLNALNVVYRRPDGAYDLRFVLAVLNSNLLRFYAQCAITAGASLTIRFSNSSMRDLPMPHLNLSIQSDRRNYDRLVELCDEALHLYSMGQESSSAEQVRSVESQIDEIVYKLYGLSDQERRLTEGASA